MTAHHCTTCGQTHPNGCHAHKSPSRGGGPCGKYPVTGLTVCEKHGGHSPQSKAKTARVRAEQAAAREVARLGRKVDTHPAEALIDLVHWTAGEVAYWRDKVVDLEEAGGVKALTWGVTKHEKGFQKGESINVKTREAGPNVAYSMLVDASNRLAAYSAAALRAGVDERRVRLAEAQGALVAQAIRAVLDKLNLTPDQWALVPTVVPAQLRLLTATTEETR